MRRFLGNFDHKVDKKNRVAVPANFRAVLGEDFANGISVMPNQAGMPCLDCFAAEYIDEVIADIEKHENMSYDQDLSSLSSLANILHITPDPEGRIIVPRDLLRQFGIGEQVVFAGLGRKFQLWEPTAFAEVQAVARAATKKYNRSRKPPPPGVNVHVLRPEKSETDE